MKKVDYKEIKDRLIDRFGRSMVLALFTEFHRPSYSKPPLFSLYDDWHPVYLEMYDPTEYAIGMTLVGDWEAYQKIRNYPKIKTIMDKWAKEAEAKLRSDAIRQMMGLATEKQNPLAIKWLAEGTYLRKVMKNSSKDEEEINNDVSNRITSDMERLGLKVVVGGK